MSVFKTKTEVMCPHCARATDSEGEHWIMAEVVRLSVEPRPVAFGEKISPDYSYEANFWCNSCQVTYKKPSSEYDVASLIQRAINFFEGRTGIAPDQNIKPLDGEGRATIATIATIAAAGKVNPRN